MELLLEIWNEKKINAEKILIQMKWERGIEITMIIKQCKHNRNNRIANIVNEFEKWSCIVSLTVFVPAKVLLTSVHVWLIKIVKKREENENDKDNRRKTDKMKQSNGWLWLALDINTLK